MDAGDARRALYPTVEPYRSGRLRVSDVHEIYFEESGNPEGKAAVFLHGGPGGGTDPVQRRFWDPARYRIVLFDQRGCGQSTPHACLEENTTWDLVEDMEKLRAHLGIDRWQLFGGSWGSTLALAYAESHPARVTELVLRGLFLIRERELRWYYHDGANRLFPDAWERFVAPLTEGERSEVMTAYHARLTADDPVTRREAALAWSMWEGSTSRLRVDPKLVARTGEPHFAEALARIECHYFINRGFMKRDGQLLADIDRVRHIPAVLVQGRYDVVTAPETAWELHRAWPEAQLRIIDDAGHSALEPGIASALVEATDRFAS